MDFEWTRDDDEYRAEVRAFLSEQLPEGWSGYDQADFEQYERDSKRFCRAMAERGWLTQNWPTEYGGQDASPWRAAVLSEELWSIGEPRGPQYMNANWIGPAIMRYGTEAQKQLHLTRISGGDVCWCQGFSEPEAGSDLASLRTTAVRDGDDYVVNGTKVWTSHVGIAEYCFLLVRTDPDSRRGDGISCLLVRMDTPGIETTRIPGFKIFHQLAFQDTRVPVDCRLGEENGGWEVVRWALAFERVGAAHHRTAELTLERHAAHARATHQFDDPEVAVLFAEAWEKIEAARRLYYRVVDLRAHDHPPNADSNISRIAGNAAHKAVADVARQIYAEEALVADGPGDSRSIMTYSVAAGATEIQLDQVAIRHLGLPRVR